ncbi:MurNAc alpha-1-phosphate uridylyltransferase [Octadecabacter temperatus]|uniref:Glucose-1-phosphate cytidylyltransferase n=1 Tax=Octadecabacter temperatus TaxID=1458307 RepID=A0A0K0Y9Y2_9RHOB|nr:nucleotidyltransferase family protein [Octadecabacter temperatus]AKS47738.1 Glucose-1-phosphate cytidylyltransferase [Octadecabacter temperatus]SIO39189.1 MurNAc alpha-1-phosphate uridylyltransferase [Octadecabacter temperatus]
MSEHPNAILLFAAGLGTRMAPLTNKRPKPLVEVSGKPLLDHALAQCSGLKAVVNTHYFAEQIHAHLAGTDVLVSDESDQLLETGGGLKRALPLLDSNPVLTMNTDAVWRGSNPVECLKDEWRPKKMDALLLMIPTSNAVGHNGSGDFDIDSEGRLSRGSEYVYSGVQVIRTDGLASISLEAFSMWALWESMLANETMFGVVYDGQWCDVGRPDSIPVAEDMLAGDPNV